MAMLRALLLVLVLAVSGFAQIPVWDFKGQDATNNASNTGVNFTYQLTKNGVNDGPPIVLKDLPDAATCYRRAQDDVNKHNAEEKRKADIASLDKSKLVGTSTAIQDNLGLKPDVTGPTAGEIEENSFVALLDDYLNARGAEMIPGKKISPDSATIMSQIDAAFKPEYIRFMQKLLLAGVK